MQSQKPREIRPRLKAGRCESGTAARVLVATVKEASRSELEALLEKLREDQ